MSGDTGEPQLPDLDALRRAVSIDVTDQALLHALTHSTWAYENGGENNERLEFLGDAVLGLSVTTLLYRHYPELPEGELAKRRAVIVSTSALARVAQEIDLGQYLRLGRGEELTDGRQKPSLLADGLEALLGAVYLEAGHEAAGALVERLMGAAIADPETFEQPSDPKTTLQEWLAQHSLPPARYVLRDEGPDHQKTFHAEVYVDHPQHSPGPVGRGIGSSKKQAEIDAAHQALTGLRGR